MGTSDLRRRTSADSNPRSRSLEHWQSFLSAELGCRVMVLPSRARKRPLQVRPLGARRAWRLDLPRGAMEVRLHALFDDAPTEVQSAVASWIRSGRRAPRACAVLDAWIAAGLERLPRAPIEANSLRTQGATHDLARLANELRREHFAHEFEHATSLPPITWGRSSYRGRRRSLRLGSCDPEGRIVRLHPVLDQPLVPEFFVRYVLFHELVHACIPPRKGKGGRWIHHGPDFVARERAYPEYARACDWEKRNLDELLRSARHGEPMRAPKSKRRAALAKHEPEQAERGWLQRLLFG